MNALLVGAALLAALGSTGAAPASGAGADDDLAVVRQALGQTPPRAGAADEARREGHAARRSEPRWLRVRVVEKPGGHERVSIRLPLRLAHALGHEVDWDCGEPATHRCSLSQVLELLDSGEDLVEIDGVDARVRVWVE